MESLINKHTERFSQGKISHDVEAKPKEPVVGVDRMTYRFSQMRFQLATILDNSIVVALESYSLSVFLVVLLGRFGTIPFVLKPLSQIRLRQSCSSLSRRLTMARNGWRRSYQAGFEQVVVGSSIVETASGTSTVISEGPGIVSLVNMNMCEYFAYQFSRKDRILCVIVV